MRKNIIKKALLLSLLALGASAFARQSETVVYPVSEYHVDDWRKLSDNMVNIPCKWDFYWGRFITWNDYSLRPDCSYVAPLRWNNFPELAPEIREITKTGKGSGTFRARITGLKPNTSYGFFAYDFAGTAAKGYCNGKLFYQAGEPYENWELTKSQTYMEIATFISDPHGVAEITFYVSNKDYRKGGLWASFQIEEASGCYQWYNRKICSNSLVLAILLTVVIYALIVGLLRKDESYIFLALYVFAIFIRCLCADFPIIKHIFPELSYSWGKKLEFFALFTAPCFYTLYINAMNRDTYGNKVWLFIVPSAILTFIDLCLPLSIANRAVPLMQAYMFIVIILDIVFIFIQIIKKKNLVSIFSISTLFIVGIGAVNDIASANSNFIFAGVKILTYTFVIYAFCQTAFLAYLQNKNQQKASKLNGYFNESNEVYLKYVPKQLPEILGKKSLAEVETGDAVTKNMAVLSVDLRNFTASTQGISDSRMLEVLNLFAETVNPVIRSYKGFVQQKYGDEIVALFPENPENALDCALAIQEKLVQFRSECKDVSLPVLKAGIGVHYGPVTVGAAAAGEEFLCADIVSEEMDTLKETEQLTKTFKKCIIVTKDAIKAATKSAKEKGKKFDFNGIRMATEPGKIYYSIYNSKVSAAL